MPTLLLEGPFESDYSLAIVNKRLAQAISRKGLSLRLHQRDNTTPYFPGDAFLQAHADLARLFVRDVATVSADVHSRNIYPPHTDGFRGWLHVMHCYAWEESAFPQSFVQDFNRDLHLVTVTSGFVRDVLRQNGVRVPVEVVGNGADHILSKPAKAADWLRDDRFNFLHISSCFPRKAPEILVRAFCMEFTRREDVRLIIKTFANPHNEIDRIVREIGAEYPQHAPMQVVWDPLDLGTMRYLYEHAGCLVSASRGEGFGLPAAEAMATGCPVIATVHSGQADLCTPDTCWPVEFALEPARTHLTEGVSYWASPSLVSLRVQMRAVYTASPQQRLQKTAAARRFVMDRFTWDHVAERHWGHCQDLLAVSGAQGAHRPIACGDGPTISFVTTWNTRCGIAEYTRYLATSLPAGHRIAIFANRVAPEDIVRPDEDFVSRCWEPPAGEQMTQDAGALWQSILASGVRAVSIQYNFGFFSPPVLNDLLERLQQEGIVTTITMHAVKHPNFPRLKEALRKADFCICHRQADVDALRGLGVENVLLRKQGILASRLSREPVPARERKRKLHFVVSCFGFFLPPKGIYSLIQAFALAKAVQPLLRLKLLNSLYANEDSAEYARACLRLIQQKGLGGDVEITTAFLDHEETLRQLADSDLLVLPYLYSTESSSAAGAFALASLTPVLCSDIPLFDELAEVVHRFPAGDVHALANKILQLSADPAELNRHRAAQEEYVRARAWPAIARDFVELIAERAARVRQSTPAASVTAAS